MPGPAIPQEKLPEVKRLYYDKKHGAISVAKELGVSSSAVYSFMRRNGLVRRTFTEDNALRFQKKPVTFNIKTKLSAKDLELKVAGTMLYWAEGYQSDIAVGVDFANSKPEMIVLFLKFLRNICGIDEKRLRAYLYCYANQDITELIIFWSKLLRIPKEKFTKPYVRKDFREEKAGKMKYGLLHIRYSDKKLLNTIRLWIKEYTEALL